MRVDHVSYAAEPDGSIATAERLAARLGVEPVYGGVHPRFGTRNIILPLAHHRYVEVVECLDHPVTDKVPFGQAVRTRSEQGGGWMGWVVCVDDIALVEARVGRESVEGSRTRPDGVTHRWRQLGVKGLIADPQLPFFVQWDAGSEHPSEVAHTDITISRLTIGGSPDRVRDWLGIDATDTSSVIDFEFVAPAGHPGLLAVTFETPRGEITI
ncbi:VOC family protein [Arsenicicoccus sp. oral taxon 190]|uniref:VOC family protein n=1 Tax=Arsenicicoccus sp. oral taxon 190 TaxID=1658671 RepID=UPI000679FAA5|nr:VOC family protein [Arsenicicoccus sp. oral taxon 190]AKT50618.1 glycosyltransferase [Arsenicicoccus sp. oral taxon 190]